MDSRRAYQRIVGIVDANTANEEQGPSMSEGSLRTIAGHAGLEGDEITSALEAAIANDALVRFDRDGESRVAPTDVDQLFDVIDAELERDETDQSVIAACNRGIDAAREEAAG